MNIKSSFVSVVLSTFLLSGLSGCGSSSSSTSENNTTTETNTTVEENTTHVVHFSYDDNSTTGPSNWYKLSTDWTTCENGLTLKPVTAGEFHQSPVDFTATAPATNPNFVVDNNYSLSFAITNNGHTIQLTADTNAIQKDTLIINGKEYTLLQFHFHSLSEHTQSAQHSAMEVHFVHKAADGDLAVLGAFIDANDTVANAELSKAFVDEFPEENMNGATVSINVANILPASTVYSYSGSLTTPPCSEGVAWNVYTSHIALSEEDVGEYKVHYSDNYRPVTGDLQ